MFAVHLYRRKCWERIIKKKVEIAYKHVCSCVCLQAGDADCQANKKVPQSGIRSKSYLASSTGLLDLLCQGTTLCKGLHAKHGRVLLRPQRAD